MKPRTLRLRVAASAAVAVLLAVGALGGAVALLVAHQLRSSLDASLHSRAQDVARLAVSAPALLTAPGALDAPAGGRQLSVEVVDRHARIVARSAALGGRLLPGADLLAGAISRARESYGNGRLSGESVRLLVVPVADAGGPAAGGAVLVSSSTREIDGTLGQLGTLIALSALSAAALGALAAALLTARGLRPLRRLSEGAASIAHTGDHSQRLPDPRTHDELGELVSALNTMLGALERSQETERRFLADASHELRTPLTSLRGNLGYLLRHGAEPEALAEAEADAARLGALVDDLLTLEREGAAEAPRDTLALDALVRELSEREGCVLDAAEPASVRGEPRSLERALANLIENARVHGPAAGAVHVALRTAGGRAVLSVADEGPGLAPPDRGRAFDRFWRGTASRDRPGSGLGLSLVQAIARRHGGRVAVDGACFEIELPLVRESSD